MTTPDPYDIGQVDPRPGVDAQHPPGVKLLMEPLEESQEVIKAREQAVGLLYYLGVFYTCFGGIFSCLAVLIYFYESVPGRPPEGKIAAMWIFVVMVGMTCLGMAFLAVRHPLKERSVPSIMIAMILALLNCSVLGVPLVAGIGLLFSSQSGQGALMTGIALVLLLAPLLLVRDLRILQVAAR